MKRKRKPQPITVQEMGRRGGRARAKKLSAEERTAAARHAVNARWARWHAERDEEERAS